MQVDHSLMEMRKFVAPEFIFGVGARKRCPDYIRTFGGGSPMDCARGIGIVVANDQDILSFAGYVVLMSL